MVMRPSAGKLRGRQRERDVLDRAFEAARDGQGAVVAVYGEPGVGKTALMEYAVEAAPDSRIARAVGVEEAVGWGCPSAP
jgi:Cdc6-like AAA superfamily ATPase